MNDIRFDNLLRLWAKARYISLKALLESSGLDRSFAYGFRNHPDRTPTNDAKFMIATYLNVTIHELLKGPVKRKVKIAYIAGPYRSEHGINGIHENIERARTVAVKYWKLGYFVLCPHTNSGFMDGIQDDSFWLAAYLEALERCDVVVMMRGYADSEGAINEHTLANELGKEIIYD